MVSCVLCNSNKFRKTKFTCGKLDLIKCSNCSLIRLKDFKQEYDQKLYDFYENYSKILKTKVWENAEKIDLRNFKNLLLKHAKKYNLNIANLNHLDFGSGLGQCIEASSSLGWKSVGIEMNDFCIKLCDSKKLKVYKDFKYLNKNKKYDVITLFEVIEHLPNPDETLKELKYRLSNKGILIITCPNWNSLERFIFKNTWKVIDPEHYHYFTKKTILSILKKNNFNVKEIYTKNFNPFQNQNVNVNSPNNSDKLGSETKLRSLTSRGPGSILKKFFYFFLRFFSIGSTLQIVCK